MTTRQYIGARYVPVFADPVEWDNTRTYEHLMMVQHQGETYISQQAVPIGIDLPDTSQGEESNEYWVHMSNWNAQVESYRQEVLAYNGRISILENDLPIADFDDENTVSAAIANLQEQIGSGFSQANTIADVMGSGFSASNTISDAMGSGFSASNTIAENLAERAICFNTVSDMKASDNLADGMVCRTNGFHTANDGGAAWYAVSDTGTANEMDVIACGDFYALLIDVNDEINPIQLGAYGNGVDDDYAVINYAAQKAYTEKKKLVLPLGHTFLIETALVITNPIEFYMHSPIVYYGVGAAVTLGSLSGSWDKDVKVNVKSGNESNYYDESSIGVKLISFNDTNVNIHSVRGFYENVTIIGGANGCCYNTFNIREIINGYNLMHLIADSTNGWVNENLFIGGRFTCMSGYSTVSTYRGIIVEGSSSHQANANRFIKPCVEGAAICVILKYAVQNVIEGLRSENATKALSLDTYAKYNDVSVSYGTIAYDNTSDVFPNYIHETHNIPQEVTIYDSGNMLEKAYSNASMGTIDHEYCELSGTGTYKAPTITRNADYVSQTYYLLGVVVDTTEVKDFTVRVFSKVSGKLRAVFQPLDENGNFLSTAKTVMAPVSGVYGTDTILGVNVWSGGADENNEYRVRFSEDVKKAFIGFRNADQQPNRFLITANTASCKSGSNTTTQRVKYCKTFATVPYGLTAIPTCPATAGAFCPNTNTSTISTTLGWVYDGSNWAAMNR